LRSRLVSSSPTMSLSKNGAPPFFLLSAAKKAVQRNRSQIKGLC
jgi:hypothetical protein